MMDDGPSASPRATLLVADDDPSVGETLASMLAGQYRVLVAHDGEEALTLARTHRPSIALLDVRMPRLSGLCVAWALKNDARYEGMPVVLMRSPEPVEPLGEVRDTDAVWIRSLADGYLLKPFTSDEVMAVLDIAIGVHPSAMVHLAADERRLLPRVGLRMSARLGLQGQLVEATILSLSPRGAYVESNVELHPGTQASLSFETEQARFEGGCQVLYRGHAPDAHGVGLQFRELSPEGQAALVRLLTTQSQ